MERRRAGPDGGEAACDGGIEAQAGAVGAAEEQGVRQHVGQRNGFQHGGDGRPGVDEGGGGVEEDDALEEARVLL